MSRHRRRPAAGLPRLLGSYLDSPFSVPRHQDARTYGTPVSQPAPRYRQPGLISSSDSRRSRSPSVEPYSLEDTYYYCTTDGYYGSPSCPHLDQGDGEVGLDIFILCLYRIVIVTRGKSSRRRYYMTPRLCLPSPCQLDNVAHVEIHQVGDVEEIRKKKSWYLNRENENQKRE